MRISNNSNSSAKKMTAQAIVRALRDDPDALMILATDLMPLLFDEAHIRSLVAAIEAVNTQSSRNAPGKLYPGTIPNASANLILNGSSQPVTALVSIGGAATAVPVYVPTHIRGSIAIGQAVWVLAVNGSMSDLVIHSLRNIP